MAVPKKVGDKIIGGTLNLNGAIHMRATRVGSETGLAQVSTPSLILLRNISCHTSPVVPPSYLSHIVLDYQARRASTI